MQQCNPSRGFVKLRSINYMLINMQWRADGAQKLLTFTFHAYATTDSSESFPPVISKTEDKNFDLFFSPINSLDSQG